MNDDGRVEIEKLECRIAELEQLNDARYKVMDGMRSRIEELQLFNNAKVKFIQGMQRRFSKLKVQLHYAKAGLLSIDYSVRAQAKKILEEIESVENQEEKSKPREELNGQHTDGSNRDGDGRQV